MRKFKFSKLVRDKVVEEMIASGDTPKWRTLSKREYIQELKKKIFEESSEVPKANNKELVKELADIQEIIDSLLGSLGITKKDFSQIQKDKNKKRGSFKKKQYIDVVETKDDSQWIKYYLDNPEKYPEVKR